MSTPQFAIVGHPNKGKSSLVATLAQDDRVLIAAQSGTTQSRQSFPLQIDDVTLYTLIDTPGFQRAREVYEWLQAHSKDVTDRANTIRKFVALHQNDPRFSAETELLNPIIAGAGIIYVVDGSRPYGPEYEIEMEILRWSGQPSMALINLIGTANYVEQWQSVLHQYFKIVRLFNPLKATFDERISLLSGFSQLNQSWAKALDVAVKGLQEQRHSLKRQSASLIAHLMQEALEHVESIRYDLASSEEYKQEQETQLETAYQRHISGLEQQMHQSIDSLYRHNDFQAELPHAIIIEDDLFSSESEQLFGLDQNQLLVTSLTGGAMAGGVIDLAVGGHSFFLGAGIGAAAAGVTTWLASTQLAKTEILGQTLGGKQLTLGPVKNRNFPYSLLSRALLYHSAVSTHSHANQSREKIEFSEALLKNQDLKTRLPFEKYFSTLRKGKALTVANQENLILLIQERMV